jgi:hypothetical protein
VDSQGQHQKRKKDSRFYVAIYNFPYGKISIYHTLRQEAINNFPYAMSHYKVQYLLALGKMLNARGGAKFDHRYDKYFPGDMQPPIRSWHRRKYHQYFAHTTHSFYTFEDPLYDATFPAQFILAPIIQIFIPFFSTRNLTAAMWVSTRPYDLFYKLESLHKTGI